MLASELPYVLTKVNMKDATGDVYTIDDNGNKIPLDFVYVNQEGDLIFTEFEKYRKSKLSDKTKEGN
jgi:hypothetical protein